MKKRKKNYEYKKSKANNNAEIEDDSDSLSDYNWNENVELSTSSVFSEKYCKAIDKLFRKYGFYLMHHSDRCLPRTHIQSNYTSVGYKNANEMSGILLVLLTVFSTSEGNIIDEKLGNRRTAQYIHIIELMLMTEMFCKQPHHKKQNVRLFKNFIPIVLKTLKNTLDRKDGNQMKIIKFHLPLHFADDILRFGSMANYDSGIGESHHKDFAKKTANNTQRRREVFEFQTATRQIENLAIYRAHDYIFNKMNNLATSKVENEINKRFNIEFCNDRHIFLNKNGITKKKRFVIGKINVYN